MHKSAVMQVDPTETTHPGILRGCSKLDGDRHGGTASTTLVDIFAPCPPPRSSETPPVFPIALFLSGRPEWRQTPAWPSSGSGVATAKPRRVVVGREARLPASGAWTGSRSGSGLRRNRRVRGGLRALPPRFHQPSNHCADPVVQPDCALGASPVDGSDAHEHLQRHPRLLRRAVRDPPVVASIVAVAAIAFRQIQRNARGGTDSLVDQMTPAAPASDDGLNGCSERSSSELKSGAYVISWCGHGRFLLVHITPQCRWGRPCQGSPSAATSGLP